MEQSIGQGEKGNKVIEFSLKGKDKAIVYCLGFALMGLVIFGIGGWLKFDPYMIFHSVGFTSGVALLLVALLLVACLVVVVIMHEGLHGLCFRLFTGGVRFGFKIKSTFGPVFYTSSPNSISKSQYRLTVLAPQVLSAILLALIFAPLPDTARCALMISLAVNLGGGCGDIYVAYILGRYSGNCQFIDAEDGFRVYGSIEEQYG